MSSSDSARDIHLLIYDAAPKSLTCIKELLITSEPCHICHAAVQIHGSDCMSYCLALLPDRNMCLMVIIRLALHLGMFLFKIERRLATLVNKVFGQFFIAVLVGYVIESEQRHFSYLVAGITFYFPFLFAE